MKKARDAGEELQRQYDSEATWLQDPALSTYTARRAKKSPKCGILLRKLKQKYASECPLRGPAKEDNGCDTLMKTCHNAEKICKPSRELVENADTARKMKKKRKKAGDAGEEFQRQYDSEATWLQDPSWATPQTATSAKKQAKCDALLGRLKRKYERKCPLGSAEGNNGCDALMTSCHNAADICKPSSESENEDE